MTATTLPVPRSSSCPAWCDGIERHDPLTYAEDEGTHARQHTRRAGGWLLAEYSLTTGEGAVVPAGVQVEWSPINGQVGTPEAERDNLASLLTLCPGAATPTFADMEHAGHALGLNLTEWVRLLDGVAFDHPREVPAPDCPAWCDAHGRLHQVNRDSAAPGAAPTIRHEWHQQINPRAWVSLTRFDWPDEPQPTTEIVVEDGGEGLTLPDARSMAEGILEALRLAGSRATTVAGGSSAAPALDRCTRCGHVGEAVADGWLCTMRAGVVTETTCQGCQTPVERAEAARNAEQVTIMGTNAEGQVLGSQRQAPVRVVLDLDPAAGGRDSVCVERDGGLSDLEVLRAAGDAIAAASDTVRGVWS